MNEFCCKWVSDGMKTRNDTFWEEGVPNELPEADDLVLCFPGLFHYYEHPLIAIVFKNFDACSYYTKLYQVKPEGKIVKDIAKCGATKLTFVKELEIPEVTLIQKVAFAILCAKEVYQEESFIDWANNWLSGKDRSYASAQVAVNIAKIAVDAAEAAFRAAYPNYADNDVYANVLYTDAAINAALAALAASMAANPNYGINATSTNVHIVDAVRFSTKKKFDLISLAEQAMEVK